MASRKANTTERGLGWSHQQDAARLHRRHVDATPCWWCTLPMFTDAARNWDHAKLAADHSIPRAAGGQRADRLLHSRCNGQRSDGRWDNQRPAITGQHPIDWRPHGDTTATVIDVGTLAMDW